MPPTTADKLLPAIKQLIGEMLIEVGGDDPTPTSTYLDMAETSPLIGSALQVITLLAVARLGTYSHPDPDPEAFIRKNFEQMNGSLALSFEELMSCFALGSAVAQWGVEPRDGATMLIDIQILHPALYTFEGRYGKIENIVFRSGDGADVKIPYDGEDGRIVHVVNGRHLAFRKPRGIPALKRCLAAWKAWKIVIGEMLVAAQRQATPIVVGYSDSGATIPMLDATGQPLLDADGNQVLIPVPTALLNQLESLDNRSVISTDMKNKIETLEQQTSGTFFFEALRLLGQLQLIGLIFPETILTATGTGDSNLNTGQRTTLGLVVESLVDQIKEVILNGPVRWLLFWNYGAVDNFGSFPSPEADNTDAIALLNALGNGVDRGLFSAADLAVINRGRELAGLPPSEEPSASMGRLLSGLNLNYWQVPENGQLRSANGRVSVS